jgi:hypothetical protein
VTSHWRTGLLVFVLAALAGLALVLKPALPDVWRLLAGRPALPPARHSPLPGAVPPESDADGPLLSRVRIAVTNLPAGADAPRRTVAADGVTGPRGIAGAGRPAAVATNRGGRLRADLPVIAALRNGIGRPVPPPVAALARQLTAACRTDAERARALYDWVTSHIGYDMQEWASIVGGAASYQKPQDPLSVLERGTAVCAGYAWLYADLCRAAGLTADAVIGDVRGYRGTADDALISPFQHAWNSVALDGTWHLLDATWGARQAGETAAEYQARAGYYFLTPPGQLIFDHLPENADWQLLPEPVPDDAFARLPNLKPAFFTDGLRLGGPFSDAIRVAAGQPTGVTLAAPEGVQITATLTAGSQDASAGNLFLRENGARRDVIVAPLPAGDYLLRLYVRNATGTVFECAADYAIQVGP